MNIILDPNQKSSARRFLLLVGFGSVIAASWAWLGLMFRDMSAMPGMSGGMTGMAKFDPFAPSYIGGLIVMWVVMQVAMMLPSALPMILGFARMKASERRGARIALPVGLFAGGYLAAWTAFGIAAAMLQAGLTGTEVLSSMSMKVSGSGLAGGILVLAGVYQWMPLKRACLRRCRTPVGFLMTEWREGPLGPLVMGLRHGLFCIGCCWAIMCLLFAAGVMNPIWIVGIAAWVLVEKVAPHGEAMTRLAGVGLIVGGFAMMLGG